MRLATLFFGMVGMCVLAHADTPPLLHELLQDHAVLQRDVPIRLWGDARRGDDVRIMFGDTRAAARADAAGHWQAVLPALGAGGPYTLAVVSSSGLSQRVDDILLGDVYLCSGQSNMELSVAGSLNGDHAASASANSRIRLLNVAHATSPAPQTHFSAPIAWRVAGPASTRDFSAVCYYFARELQKNIDVPIGLIQSSWGGSRIEPWISAARLHALGGFEEGLTLLHIFAQDPAAGNAAMGRTWERWWQARATPPSRPWSAPLDSNWTAVPEPMRDWKTWGVPELARHDGMVWFRREVTLTAAQAAQSARLSIGAIDEVDETWVNARAIANSFGYATERTYSLPRGALHAGSNSIVINVLSTWDAGGMYGPPEHLQLAFDDGSTASLAGGWRYQFVPESMGYPPRAPWESVSGLSSIYNAMIAPLQSFALTGVLWYQGESNTSDAASYATELRGLMEDWRTQLGRTAPFLIVQLPNFGAPPRVPAASAWAQLRQAQARAVAADKNAALVVTIDLGEPGDLHPRDKLDVGARLAVAARRLIYADSAVAAGPIAQRAYREANQVVVDFGAVNGRLFAYGAATPTGFELCGETQESCRFVAATIVGNTVHIADASPADRRVRLYWSDAPLCNLYDALGLPAGPFELSIDSPQVRQ